MMIVKIAELKNRLSYYLRRVQRGEAVLVSDRDHVIARIERVGAPLPGEDTEWLEPLPPAGALPPGARRPTPARLARAPAAGPARPRGRPPPTAGSPPHLLRA